MSLSLINIADFKLRYGESLSIMDKQNHQRFYLSLLFFSLVDNDQVKYVLTKLWIDQYDVCLEFDNKTHRCYISINPINRNLSSVHILKYCKKKFRSDLLVDVFPDLIVKRNKFDYL